MRRTFFIDTENVGYHWVDQLPALSKNDNIYIFISDHCVKKDLIEERLSEKISRVEYIPCRTGGHNSMDIAIAGHIGRLAARQIIPREYVIVSNDTGYTNLIETFRRNRWGSLRQQEVIISSQRSFCQMVEKSLTEMGISYNNVYKIARRHPKRTQRDALHRALVKSYGQEKGNQVYHIIKPHIHFLV